MLEAALGETSFGSITARTSRCFDMLRLSAKIIYYATDMIHQRLSSSSPLLPFTVPLDLSVAVEPVESRLLWCSPSARAGDSRNASGGGVGDERSFGGRNQSDPNPRNAFRSRSFSSSKTIFCGRLPSSTSSSTKPPSTRYEGARGCRPNIRLSLSAALASSIVTMLSKPFSAFASSVVAPSRASLSFCDHVPQELPPFACPPAKPEKEPNTEARFADRIDPVDGGG